MTNRMIELRRKTTSKIVKAKKVNLDNWVNSLTGVGVVNRDKKLNAEIFWQPTNEADAEALLSSDDMGGKIAWAIPYDGTREGITWKIDSEDENDEEAKKVAKKLDMEIERLCAFEKFSWAWTVARAYGGALAFISVDDGQSDLSVPLNPGAIRSIKAIHILNRWDVDFNTMDLISDLTDPAYGTPEFYRYNMSSGPSNKNGEQILIHHSRVIRFDGEKLPDRLFIKNDYWHDSIYGRLKGPLRNYATTHDTIATILQEINQPVYKIQGLAEAVAQDESNLVMTKVDMINRVRSSLRAIVLDSEDDFINMQNTLPGSRDLVDLTKERLTAASGIPHTRLMGESPGASLGEAGRSELIDYYDMVKAQQEKNLRRPLIRLAELIFMQIEDSISEPDEWTFEFNPLYQQDQESLIRTRGMQADIDVKYMREGVYDALEVAKSRFGTGEYSYETVLDPDLQEEREEQAREPEPEPEPNIIESESDNKEDVDNGKEDDSDRNKNDT